MNISTKPQVRTKVYFIDEENECKCKTEDEFSQLIDQLGEQVIKNIVEAILKIREQFENKMDKFEEAFKLQMINYLLYLRNVFNSFSDLKSYPEISTEIIITKVGKIRDRVESQIDRLNSTVQQIKQLEWDYKSQKDIFLIQQKQQAEEQQREKKISSFKQILKIKELSKMQRCIQNQNRKETLEIEDRKWKPQKMLFKCPICLKEVTKVCLLNKHIKEMHNFEEFCEENFVCLYCEKNFKQPSQLGAHIYGTHTKKYVSIQYKCECNKTLITKGEMLSHVSNCVYYSGIVKKLIDTQNIINLSLQQNQCHIDEEPQRKKTGKKDNV